MSKIIHYSNGNVIKTKNKKVTTVSIDNSAFIFINHLSKEFCDCIRNGNNSYVVIDINDRNIHTVGIKLTYETLSMLYISIGEELKRIQKSNK